MVSGKLLPLTHIPGFDSRRAQDNGKGRDYVARPGDAFGFVAEIRDKPTGGIMDSVMRWHTSPDKSGLNFCT